jgi:hypothetical protein
MLLKMGTNTGFWVEMHTNVGRITTKLSDYFKNLTD